MPREITFTEPLAATLFSPLQLRPRPLLTFMISGLCRWMADHTVPFSSLATEHRAAVVAHSIRLDYERPYLCFADADWMTISVGVITNTTGEWISLHAAYSTSRGVAARGRLVIRVVSLAGDASLAATPGALPLPVRARFAADEVVPLTAGNAFRAARPLTTTRDLLPRQEWVTTLYRSHCEAADQWLFIEMIELASNARERLFTLSGTERSPAVLHGVRAPVRSVRAVFRGAMFVFASCRISTSAHAVADGTGVAFRHDIGGQPDGDAQLTVWEVLDGDR